MRLHYLRGDRSAAIASFKRFERGVCLEQGSRPAAETLELLRSIEQLETRPASTALLPASLVKPPVQVGREEAMRALAAAWVEGRPVLVLGEGGIGKSRLLAESLRGRLGVLHGRARPGDMGAPYATVTALLRQAIDLFAPGLDDVTRCEMARLLPDLGSPPRHAARQPLLWHAVERLLVACVDQGMATLVVDDLHLADVASLELLRWLLSSHDLQTLRIALAARGDEPGPGAALLRDWVDDSSRLQLLRLQPLTEAQVNQLLESLSLTLLREAGPSLACALHRHAGGHPFYTLETLKALVLAGDLARPLPQPGAVGVLLERRLQRLTPPALQLLQLMALAGRELPLDVAAQALACPPLQLAPAWRELERAQLLQGNGFAHDLLRQAALATLPETLRPALHAELAQVLQAAGAASPSQLAEHWSQAGRWATAAPQWASAARAARQAGRLAECEQLHERAALAFEQAGDLDAAFFERCHAVAATLVLQGDVVALQQLQALAPLAGADASAPRQARWQTLRAEALLNQMQFAPALQASTLAMQHAGSRGLLYDDALALHGRALALTGQVREGVALLRQGLDSPTCHEDPAREMAAAAALAHALMAAGERGQALQVQKRVVQLADRLGDDTQQAVHRANLASLANIAGETALAWQQAVEVEVRMKALGADGVQARFNKLLLARTGASLGHLDAAYETLQQVLQSAPAVDGAGPTLALMARTVMCGLLTWLGRLPEALQRMPLHGEAGHPMAQASVLLAHWRVLQLLGRDGGSCERDLQALQTAHPDLRNDVALALEWARQGPPQDSVNWLRRLRRQLRNTGCPALERSLDLRELQRRLEFDGAASVPLARRLVRQIPLGLHASLYMPEAWWLLATALREADPSLAEHCRQQALQWLERARLPQPEDAARRSFELGHPLNRMVLASVPITGR